MHASAMLPLNSDEAIESGLSARRIAVVGLSSDESRHSNEVASYLQAHGYTVVPVNPTKESVLGEKAYPSLLDVPGPVDVVEIFRKPEAVPEIVEQAIEIGAPLVWMQLGVINHEAARRAQEAGVTVVMDRCMKIEHGKRRGHVAGNGH